MEPLRDGLHAEVLGAGAVHVHVPAGDQRELVRGRGDAERVLPLPEVAQARAGLRPRPAALVRIVAVRRRLRAVARAERDDALGGPARDRDRGQPEQRRRAAAARRRARHEPQLGKAERR